MAEKLLDALNQEEFWQRVNERGWAATLSTVIQGMPPVSGGTYGVLVAVGEDVSWTDPIAVFPAMTAALAEAGTNTVARTISAKVLADEVNRRAAVPAVTAHLADAGIHVPTGGTNGQVLKRDASGNAIWGADSNTTYATMTAAQAEAGTSVVAMSITPKVLADEIDRRIAAALAAQGS